MANFNSGKSLAIVLQLQKANEKETLALLDKEASSLFGRGRYAYILHDKDVLESGEIKGNHIHLVFTAESAKSSANWIKHFSDLLHLEQEAVSVEMQGSEKKCLRYLLHLDDPAKHQYDRSEVITNMPETCKKAWEANNSFVSNPTLEQLIEANKEGAKGIYNLVGLSQFDKATRVLDRIKTEASREQRMVEEVQNLYKSLVSFTANPKYNKNGSVPLKDFQEALESVSDTLERMLRYQKQMEKKKHD